MKFKKVIEWKNMIDGIWVDIPGYEGCYMVSTLGTIKSEDRIIESQTGTKRKISGRTLALKENSSGYLFVGLSKDGKTTNSYVHRLVATAFLKKDEIRDKVNHKDGNKKNNSVENLEWVSHAENVQHAYKTKLNMNKGSSHFMATGVIDNQLGQEFGSIKEWAEARKINYSTGRNILSGYSTKKEINLSFIVVVKRDSDGAAK